jgi:hypothetical protein
VAAPTNPPLLPIYTTGSSASASGSSTQARNVDTSSNIIQRSGPSQTSTRGQGVFVPDTQQAEITSRVSQGRYLHWCVDANKFETHLFHIPVPSLKDVSVLSELRSIFQAAKGFRKWFSLTDCHDVKFVMVTAPTRLFNPLPC